MATQLSDGWGITGKTPFKRGDKNRLIALVSRFFISET